MYCVSLSPKICKCFIPPNLVREPALEIVWCFTNFKLSLGELYRFVPALGHASTLLLVDFLNQLDALSHC